MPDSKTSEASDKAEQFLRCAYRIDFESPTLVTPSKDLFKFTEKVVPKSMPTFDGHVKITEDSVDRSTKVSASFGIEGSYYAFSGAAEMSLSHYNASSKKTIRADHELYAVKYSAQSNVLDYGELLKPTVVKFVKKSSVETIEKRLGHFFATEVTLGGTLHLTRIITARKDDTATSLRASIEASYGVALVGSVKAKATGGSDTKRSLGSREETCNLRVQGGDVNEWLNFDGSAESKVKCQTAWASGMTDSQLYPLNMQLTPIWEAFAEHPDLGKKAKELKSFLLKKWKASFADVRKAKKSAGGGGGGGTSTVEPGTYYIRTCAHGPGSQPEGWGLAAWKDIEKRNHVSAWVYVHAGDHWPSKWDIVKGKNPGTYRIKWHSGPGGNCKGYGLSAWNGIKDSKRNHCSSWVACHDGDHWPCDWTITPGKYPGKTWKIKTCDHGAGGQPSGWGLSAWHGLKDAKRNHVSTRVAAHAGDHWPCEWTLTRA